MRTKYLGIDIGGTKIKTVVLDENGKIQEQSEVFTKDSFINPDLWKKTVLDLIKSKTNTFSPELIVVGGGITTGAGNALFNPLNEFM
jgi:glucokinase